MKIQNGIQIYKCGTQVEIPIGEIDGWVSNISINFDNISYEISYFIERGVLHTIWLNESQFITGKRKIKIGFKNE